MRHADIRGYPQNGRPEALIREKKYPSHQIPAPASLVVHFGSGLKPKSSIISRNYSEIHIVRNSHIPVIRLLSSFGKHMHARPRSIPRPQLRPELQPRTSMCTPIGFAPAALQSEAARAEGRVVVRAWVGVIFEFYAILILKTRPNSNNLPNP